MRVITKPQQLFDYTDKIVLIYLKKIIRLYSQLTSTINKSVSPNVLEFDELNVMSSTASIEITRLYDEIRKLTIEMYLYIYERSYKQANDEFYDDVKAMMVITDILSGYNGVTKYVFDSEIDRKRARLFESVMGAMANGKTPAAVRSQIKKDVETSRNLMARQIEQYADEVTIKSVVKAYKDLGIKRVRWHAYEDNRVCADCHGFDGRVFDIDDLPPIPYHYHCRCWITPEK